MKKILGMVLVLLLMLTASFALADSAESFTFDYDWLHVTGYTGGGGDITLPGVMINPNNKETQWRVLAAAPGAFAGNSLITGVTIPQGYQTLHQEAFSECVSLTRVSFPDGLAIIDDRAFFGCTSLQEITLPAGLSFIGSEAFYGAKNLASLRFEGPAPHMEMGAFGENAQNLTFYVPDDAVEAYRAALSYAMGLDAAISILSGGQDAKLFDHTAVLGQALTVGTPDIALDDQFDVDAATGTLKGYKGFCARVDIPQSIGGVPVLSVGFKAFSGNGYVFYVTIPEGVTLIEKSAFDSIPHLAWAGLPSTLTDIGENAFYGFAGERLVLNEGLESIGRRAFGFTAGRLTEITFPTTLRSIGDEAFYSSGVKTIDLQPGLQSIGDKAFAASSLQGSLLLPEGLETIGSEAFARTDLEQVTLPSTLKLVGDRAFSFNMKLKLLALSGTALPEFGEDVFEKVSLFYGTGYGEQLGAPVTLPRDSTQEEIAAVQAAFDAMGLRVNARLASQDGLALMAADTFDVKFKDDMRLLADYTGTQSEIIAPEKYGDFYLDGVSDEAFKEDQILTAFAVPHKGKYVYIGSEAFAGSSLASLDLSTSVTTIGEGAFADTQLREIDLSSVTNIGAGAFQNTPLTRVTLNENTTFIGENAFEGTNLESFVIPAGIPVDLNSLKGISPDIIRISDKATDEQKSAWNSALGYPRCNPLLRESEVSAYRIMPNTPNDEADFTIDPKTGMLLSYVGSTVDVVIPRSIGGVPVTAISYSAFDIARDYTNTDVLPDENARWLPLRSVVIPETVTMIEDSAFSLCQQLKLVICYGPLESTGRAAFQFCHALEDVIFVNDVRLFDNYLFSNCESLRQVYYPATLDLIGVGAFEFSDIKSFTADARVIEDTAFRDCIGLGEIHIRGSVKKIALNALYGCTSLHTICLETKDASIFDSENGYCSDCGENTLLILPPDTSDEEMQAFYNILSAANLGPIASTEHILREDCAQKEQPLRPEPEALLAALGEAPAFVPPVQSNDPLPETTVSAQAEDVYLGDWHLIRIIMDEVTYQAADLDLSAIYTFSPDGAGLGTFDDEEQLLTWHIENGLLMIDDGDGDSLFTLNEDGTLWADDGEGVVMIFSREKPEASSAEVSPAVETAVLEDFIGEWTLSQVSDGHVLVPAAAMEMEAIINIYGETADFTMMGETTAFTCRMEGYILAADETMGERFTLHEDGRMSTVDSEKTMWLVRTGEAAQQAAATPVTASSVNTELTGVTWVCTQAEASGYPMDVALLGRYAAVFHTDQTADMAFAGVDIVGATWTDDGETISVDYYGVPYVFEWVGDSLQLNYFDAMLLTYERE